MAYCVQSEWTRQLVNISPPILALMDSVDERSESSNDSVIYTILSGNEQGYFSLDSEWAELYLLQQLDRENIINDHFSLVVQASPMWPLGVTDPSQLGRLSLARVVVNVVDVNDNAPSFDVTRRSISIVENLPQDFNVIKLIATDPDQVNATQS